jgi:hypothetical protein
MDPPSAESENYRAARPAYSLTGKADLASWKVMSRSNSRRFPVTVTQLPVIRCQVCLQTMACRPGQASAVLTEHYRRLHPDVLAAAADRRG